MSKHRRAGRAWRALGAAIAWSAAGAARAFLVLAGPVLGKLGLAAGSSVAALLLAGGAATGYYLLHRHDPAHRSVVLRRRQPGGRLRETTVPVGAARGEDRPQLAHAEGLPVAGSQPLPGVSQALGGGPGRPPGSMPAAAAPAQALSDGRALDSDYLQALATSTMVRIDDRPDRAMGWPLLSYCRAGVRALQCHHNDLWLRNPSPVDIRDLRICLPEEARAYYALAGAAGDACLNLNLKGGADAHLDLLERKPAQPGYPPFAELRLQLSLPSWRQGGTLAELRLPVARPQTFYALPAASQPDRQHALVVQTRRVDLLTELVVFSYHGSAGSSASVRRLSLRDPARALRLIGRKDEPWAFRHYHVAQCSARAHAGPGRAHVLQSGASCAVLVSTRGLVQASRFAELMDPHHPQRGATQGAPGGHRPADPGPLPETRYYMGNLQAAFNMRLQGGSEPTVTVRNNLRVGVVHMVLAGGDFTSFGRVGLFGTPAPHLLMIGGLGFSEPLSGLLLMPQDQIDAISVSPDQRDLYIGGVFHPLLLNSRGNEPSNLGVYHHGHWVFWRQTRGPVGKVRALDHTGTSMLVGGDFRAVGHRPSYGLAQFLPAGPEQRAVADAHWHLYGARLQQVRGGPPRESEPGRVYSLLTQDNGSFFIGGCFGLNLLGRRAVEVGTMPSVSYANVLLWSRAARQWRGLGMLLGGPSDDFDQSHVDALAQYRNQLLAGGDFVYAGVASPTLGLREFPRGDGWAAYQNEGGGSWGRVIPDAQVRADIHAFAVTPSGLYAGGQMVNLEGERRVLLRMNPDGSLHGEDTSLAVEPLVQPGSAPASLRALAAIGDTLYLGGDFNRLNGGAEASDIASFDGTQASAFDAMGYSQGVNATVRALRAVWVLSVRPLR
jgi:hypothetical protein